MQALAAAVGELRASGKTVVHCHGTFDLVHPGHIRHFQAARAQGDALVVTVTPDVFVNKGPGRPVFNERLRAESIAALEAVELVAINEWPTAVEAIGLIRPDVYAKGADYERREDDLTGMILEEESAVLATGGRIHFTQDVTFSSTQLLNAHFDVFPPEAGDFLSSFRERHSADDIIQLLESLCELDVVVVGDAIIDEYHYCRPYGMARKSSTIAAQVLRQESYLGGALAVANHLAAFCRRVCLISCLGSLDSRESEIRAGLKPNVEPHFVMRDDAPTVIKRRYVQPFLTQKLFEVSFFTDAPLADALGSETAALVARHAADADLTVVADFDNGFLGPQAITALGESARFLAVNAQSNAINLGFNDITKYARADYACLDREEALLAVRDRFAQLDEVAERLAAHLGASLFTVTRGPEGAIVRSREEIARVPAFSTEVVDTIGAGDAFLALTSPLAFLRAEPEVIGFVGNAVGTLAVKIIGNRDSVERAPLYRLITTLLK